MKLSEAKISAGKGNEVFLKIPIDQLVDTGNVRLSYNKKSISELAESIRSVGLLQPVVVKPGMEDGDGIKRYSIIAGHRRVRALKKLCDEGADFSLVECVIRTGEMDLLQMTENIQRDDLSPREKEAFVRRLLEAGYTITDIAKMLSKTVSWVSDVLAGSAVRDIADKAGIGTEKINTKALSQLRTIPHEKKATAIRELAENGGTVKEATRIMNEYKQRSEPPLDFAGGNGTGDAEKLQVPEKAEAQTSQSFDIEESPEKTESEPLTVGEIIAALSAFPRGLPVLIHGVGARTVREWCTESAGRCVAMD